MSNTIARTTTERVSVSGNTKWELLNPGPSEDAPNRGLAIDLMKDNPNQTRPKKQRILFQSRMFRVEKGAENSVLVTDVHVALGHEAFSSQTPDAIVDTGCMETSC